MKKVNVIDLDNTLLPYDSFGRLVKKELKSLDLFVWYISGLRIMRLLSNNIFKHLLIKYWEKKHTKIFFNSYAEAIYNELDTRVLDIVTSKTDINTINILISASPHLYVKRLLILLNWSGSGSYFEEGVFVNLYSKEKISWLMNNFPKSEFFYQFSISDSKSDIELMQLFDESILWSNKM
jgi:hypothetical protein